MGLSKTRLAKDIGKVAAQRLNGFLLSRALKAATDSRWQCKLMVAPDTAVSNRNPDWPRYFDRQAQGSGSLGDRMARALYAAPAGNVAFIGTDMPEISSRLIAEAFNMLKCKDAVFGPADDGGFWLYAQRKTIRSKSPFNDVRWSTKFALEDVRRNLENQNIGYLPTFVDLDDAEAMKKWREGR